MLSETRAWNLSRSNNHPRAQNANVAMAIIKRKMELGPDYFKAHPEAPDCVEAFPGYHLRIGDATVGGKY